MESLLSPGVLTKGVEDGRGSTLKVKKREELCEYMGVPRDLGEG